MPRGGYRKPADKGAKVSGPGKASKRTDGMEKPRTPNTNNSDLQYGDKQRLEAAQDIAPRASRGAPPSQNPPSSRADVRGAPLDPSYLFGRPTDNPSEPITAGLDMGAGPGSEVLPPELRDPPDEIEDILMALWETFNDQGAMQMLARHREQKMSMSGGGPLAGSPTGAGALPSPPAGDAGVDPTLGQGPGMADTGDSGSGGSLPDVVEGA